VVSGDPATFAAAKGVPADKVIGGLNASVIDLTGERIAICGGERTVRNDTVV